MAELLPYKGSYYLWKYLPSLPATIIFVILFSSITGSHLWRLRKTRLLFCLPMLIGGIFEVTGYLIRIAAHFHTDQMPPYLLSNTFILLGPALFAATIYMTLGRIILSLDAAHLSPIPVRWSTRFFVMGDVLSFMIQGGAAGLMFKLEMQQTASHIVIAGLMVQVVMFGLFILTTIVFERRLKSSPTATPDIVAQGPMSSMPKNRRESWQKLIYMLYAVSALVFIRSLFRVVEYADGMDGYLLSHEWTLYVFDALPMWLVMVFFYIYFPLELKQEPQGRSREPHGASGSTELLRRPPHGQEAKAASTATSVAGQQ